MRTKKHPYVRLNADGRYEYGIYTEGGRKPDRPLGRAETREAAYRNLIGTLGRWHDRCLYGAALAVGAGVGLLILNLLAP